VYSLTSPESVGNSFFADWDKALDYICQKAKDERIILAIDEYPYLAGNYRTISSILQAQIDAKLKDSKLFLILCGSSMSFMENQVLGYKSPLYGRRTAQFKIESFDFFDSLPFLDGFEKTDKAVLYGVTGGIPEYLTKINAKQTVRENIINLFLTPQGHFYEEPTNLIKQELREPAVYNGIIEAIAKGASRLNEIATHCGMESNKCSKYLASLISLGIVKKEKPVTETVGKRSIYLLADQMFRFWYRFVFPSMSTIVGGLGAGVYDNEVAPRLNAFMGLVFEQMCRQYVLKLARADELPFFFGRIGRWWGGNPKLKRQEEIDLLAYRDDTALFGECKWTNAPVDVETLRGLDAKSRLFRYQTNYYYLFAKSGFTDSLIAEAAKRGDVSLVCFADM
jgi:AAA+ ATPase superfamily predicted ATPase